MRWLTVTIGRVQCICLTWKVLCLCTANITPIQLTLWVTAHKVTAATIKAILTLELTPTHSITLIRMPMAALLDISTTQCARSSKIASLVWVLTSRVELHQLHLDS